MTKEIAVYINDEAVAASLLEPGKVIVYRRGNGVWEIDRELEFKLDPKQGLYQLRQNMAKLISFMGECTIFAGLSVTGVPYFEFEKADISVWEIEGRPDLYLDDIFDKEAALARRTVEVVKPSTEAFVEEVSHGCYFIDLKKVQQSSAGVTSKQVLLPLLKKENFTSISILCKHIPPWLEGELLAKKMVCEINTINDGEMRINIQPKCCS
ncbi:hypothetical protein P22_3023 [Propionispora sp. 2/2-37]|uniref:Fe-only nitrogenase accessory AnfO family protein n=1 Tax=Propionispora sp. 2/2-37 TaxID=1677858 RepID=UPI0006BB83A8|nr:Fe-only nitrogenase accessory AnfO family protein [Propionispora sp. 2/2-37]CUH96911.1 hypothetical protein P22_3023 [Propionispora sp. 2/2-37]